MTRKETTKQLQYLTLEEKKKFLAINPVMFTFSRHLSASHDVNSCAKTSLTRWVVITKRLLWKLNENTLRESNKTEETLEINAKRRNKVQRCVKPVNSIAKLTISINKMHTSISASIWRYEKNRLCLWMCCQLRGSLTFPSSFSQSK